MIEAPKLVDKTLFLFFDFMLTIVVAAGSNFSKLQTEVDATSTSCYFEILLTLQNQCI